MWGVALTHSGPHSFSGGTQGRGLRDRHLWPACPYQPLLLEFSPEKLTMGILQAQGDLRSPPPTAPSIEGAEAPGRTVSKPLAARDTARAEVPRWSARPRSAGCYPLHTQTTASSTGGLLRRFGTVSGSPDLDFQAEVSFAK